MKKYANRQQAGLVLAEHLKAYANREDVFILALARGGVPVAAEIARLLHAPLDVFIVRKLGVPGHSELAMGAIASGGACIFNAEIIQELQISQEQIDAVKAKEWQELQRREQVYRGNKLPLRLKDKTIILVDDGIATGASMRAAIHAIRQLMPACLIIAVPVADKIMCDEITLLADDFICPLRPSHFYAVGAWYDDFSQTEDAEVQALLNNS